MTESSSPPSSPQTDAASASKAKTKRHRKVFWSTLIFFLFCGVLYLVYWWWWGQFSESTDDAYVNGNLITVTPQIDGIVTMILVDNTQLVEVGQPLVELDRHDYEIAFEGSKADLAQTVRDVVGMFFKVEELQAKTEVNRANLARATLDYEHRLQLVDDGSVSREEFEHRETTLSAAFAALVEVEKELAGAQAQVENTTVFTHPKVEQAKAMLRKNFLSLHRCCVRAPTRGIITQRKAQVGQWVQAMDPLMALVPIDQMWVDANFREVSLKYMRIGQPVTLISDMYGRGVKYHGKIVGLNPGTGSVFSVLPPQNATGNWIKIIQRIPVKISFTPRELKDHPLVLGLSMTAHVSTRDRTGLQLPLQSPVEPVYVSPVYTDELAGVEEIIEEIVKCNQDYDRI
jgi:membrane fusion protein, multidrug efflux system